jgi:hypothetical protein
VNHNGGLANKTVHHNVWSLLPSRRHMVERVSAAALANRRMAEAAINLPRRVRSRRRQESALGGLNGATRRSLSRR